MFCDFAQLLNGVRNGAFESDYLHCVVWSGSYVDRVIHEYSAYTNLRLFVALSLEADLLKALTRNVYVTRYLGLPNKQFDLSQNCKDRKC